MLEVWNFGNTTVRNPNRIEIGLKLFANEFQGRLTGDDAEINFANRLIEEDVVSSESEGDKAAWLARKWRSVLTKLGFATNKNYRLGQHRFTPRNLADIKPELNLQGFNYELTPSGNNLLRADSLAAIHDVYLRQLLAHEVPNPIESNFSDGMMKPFIFLLQVLHKLHSIDEPGLTKIEVSIFIQPFINHTQDAVNNITSSIIEFRQTRANLNSHREKREFENNFLQDRVNQFDRPIQPDTMLAYADTTFRYSSMTGLVSYNRDRLKLKEERLDIINNILDTEPNFLAQQSPFEYLLKFYRGSILPTDDLSFSQREIVRLREQILQRGEEPRGVLPEDDAEISELERIRYDLLEQLGWLDEANFADDQSSEDAILEIIDYLERLASGRRNIDIDHPPSYLEWAVWRGFLAFDHIINPIHETRGFSLDENLLPRNTAPGGRPDMLFEFQDFVLAVEVTLTSSSRQLVAEGESVRRHVADIKEQINKDIYCLFIAPDIDNNTAETFRIGIWYRGDVEDYLNIVPIQITEFINVISLLQSSPVDPSQLRQLFDRCLAYRNSKAPQWKRIISETTNSWRLSLIAHQI